MPVSTIDKAICIVRRKKGFSLIFVIKRVGEKQGVGSGPRNFFTHGGEPRDEMTEAAAYHSRRTPLPPTCIDDLSPGNHKHGGPLIPRKILYSLGLEWSVKKPSDDSCKWGNFFKKGGEYMKRIDLNRTPFVLKVGVSGKFKKWAIFRPIVEATKLVFITALTVFLLLEYFPPALSSPRMDSPGKKRSLFSLSQSSYESSAQEVLDLAGMIRLITDDRLSESKVLRYAGLIWHASQKYAVNPLEIIALMMAESSFKESGVNAKTGDYGLGQINWKHWGQPYGLTQEDLLDPALNIYLTCHVYKFFEQDFGKYHRGNGIKSQAYLVNVKGILSTLRAFAESTQNNIS